VTTALEIPANWFPDPSGRADARYWDGRMWTAHVVREGVTALDPLDGVQQPRGPGPFAPGLTPTPDAPQVGHGTLALQEMAAKARSNVVRRIRSMPITSEPRISTRGAIGVFLFALLLLIVGALLFHEGALTVDTPPPQITQTVVVDQPEYRVTFPNDWARHAGAAGQFDAVYAVPDRDAVSVGVVDSADPSLADATVREAHLAAASDTVAGWIGDHPTLVSRSTAKVGDTTLRVATYDVTNAFGVVTRVVEYVVVGTDRAVVVAAYGPRGAVERHLAAAAAAASTARFKPPVPVPASSPGSGAGTASTRSPR
jgi:hypothetical protein